MKALALAILFSFLIVNPSLAETGPKPSDLTSLLGTPTPEPKGTLDNPQNVGRSVTLNCQTVTIYSAEVVESTGGSWGPIDPESKYLVVDFELRNACENGEARFHLQHISAEDTGSGRRYNDTMPTFDLTDSMVFTMLEPSRKIRGPIAITIDHDMKRAVISWETDLQHDQIIYFEVNVRLPGQE